MQHDSKHGAYYILTNTNYDMSYKFANLTGDAVFKTIFCDRQDTSNLVLLLNTFLPEEAKIEKITEFIDRELDPETTEGKTAFLDLHCKNDKDEEFIVEMQSYEEVNTYIRFVYYCAKAFCDNAKKGDRYYEKLRPVYTLVLMGEDFKEDCLKGDDELVSYISVTNKNPKKKVPQTMNWIFVRMFLMNKPNYEDCTSDEERCIWILRNIHKYEEYPSWVQSAKYKGFVKSAEIANFGAEKRKIYNKAMLSDQRIESIKKAAEDKGLAEGLKQGEAKGKSEGAAETNRAVAKALISKGVSFDIISSATGLSQSELSRL